jgi:hypothetical protein
MGDLKDYLAKAGARFMGTELPAVTGNDKASPNYQSIPELSAGQIVRPSVFPLLVSAGAIWNPVSVLDRKMRLFVPNAKRTFNYVAHPLTKAGASLIADGDFSTGVGYIDLTRGNWMVNVPLAGAEVEGSRLMAVLQDAALGNQFDVSSSIGLSDSAPFDLASIHGVALTGFDWTGQRLKDVVWGIAAVINPAGGANFAVLPANPARRALAVFNNSPSGGASIALSTEDPVTSLKGFFIPAPGVGYIWDPPAAVTKQKLNGWASVGGGQLIVNEGT